MKNLLIIIILCFSLTVTAQTKDSLLLTKNEWVNKNLDYLRFYKDSVVSNLNEAKQELLFDIKNRKLSFKVAYYVGGASKKTEEFNFKIKQLYRDKLVIAPIDKAEEIKIKNYHRLNTTPFLKEKQYIFYNRGQLISKINFKKVTFHASTCFGTCPSMSVEINRDGTVYYQGRIFTKKFTGNFIGKLSPKQIYALRKMLNRSQLRVLDQQWKQKTKPNDTPRYNYIVELYGGKIIEINTNDQHPILDKLSEYFLHIPEIIDLEKTNEKHQFEESHIENYRVSYIK
jgi:hypothetical protein